MVNMKCVSFYSQSSLLTFSRLYFIQLHAKLALTLFTKKNMIIIIFLKRFTIIFDYRNIHSQDSELEIFLNVFVRCNHLIVICNHVLHFANLIITKTCICIFYNLP